MTPQNPHPEADPLRILELQRQAFARGVKYREAHTYQLTNQDINVASCKEFPDPPQPREIQIDGTLYRCVNDELYRRVTGEWIHSTITRETLALSRETNAALQDLFDNPLERPNV